MKCPKCERNDAMEIYNTRKFDNKVVRYRKCVSCGYKSKSTEYMEEDIILLLRELRQLLEKYE